MRTSRSRIVIPVIAALVVGACAPGPSPSPATAQPHSAPPPTASAVAELPPDPNETPASAPPVAGLVRVPVTVGATHSCALTSVGAVRCWGSDGYGELGNGVKTPRSLPVEVPGLTNGVAAVAIGVYQTCTLTSSGGVKCWGTDVTSSLDLPPTDVPGLTSGVVAITAGGQDTCALNQGGGVKCWSDGNAALFGTTPNYGRTPVDIAGLTSGVASVATSGDHACALTEAGEVKCWGYNYRGQLGDGTKVNSTVPVDVAKLGGHVQGITVGLFHTCAITSRGGVKCWGDGRDGQLGNGTAKASAVPVDVKGLASGVVAIAAGISHTCALMSAGKVKCWGSNQMGQLGNDSMTGSTVPGTVTGLSNGVTSISTSYSTTCATGIDRRVTCWGDNGAGQLGTASACTSSSAPVDVPMEQGAADPTSEEFVVPVGKIKHATGPTDVLLRFDMTPDVGSGKRATEIFQPGPEFTLYGDGTMIFRNDLAQPPDQFDAAIRGRSFKIARVSEARIQSLVRYAITTAGLGDACERYADTNGRASVIAVLTVRAGGLDKRVLVMGGPGPFKVLANKLRKINRSGELSTKDWAPNRYWGSLLEADALLKSGSLPQPYPEPAAWPWPGVSPKKFVGLAGTRPGRRVMTRKEAAVLGLTQAGGVVERIFLRGPDGETIYAFSMWPMAPDEMS
jgi:alpha-tubulin suppressor-like RCC1 family protein